MESTQSSLSNKSVKRPSTQELERQSQKDSLQLSRIRILHDLDKAANPRYRQVLLASLEFLDNKLKLLD